ncbi:MAG: ATP-dependent helicase HrpB [Treponema sp.]|nr:ATP-dependent helicase HrpB [Treponema sp.]
MKDPDLSARVQATGLPLVARLDEIAGALEESRVIVLRADPGTGKSTLAPIAFMDSLGGKIFVLEPRRAAAQGIAARIARILGERAGERAGYSVRLKREVSAATRIEVVTDGIMLRRLQESPAMLDEEGCAVVFDEFHERSARADLALALVMDLLRMGAKARVAIMSATMDAEKIAAAFNARMIDCPGKIYPLEISHHPLPGKGWLGAECAAALANILFDEFSKKDANASAGDILAFLPGKGEIAACQNHLLELGLDKSFDVLALHGGLSLEQQRGIIAGREQGLRRVILSTNVAETSLTIPGVELVVDSGYARILRLHPPSGMNRLSLERASQASAAQRAGRAARLGPGRCVRLWAAGNPGPAEAAPEIRRSDIAWAALECLLWGARRPSDLFWPEAPTDAAWENAVELLRDLGAAQGTPPEATQTGRDMARLGLEPRLARLCIAGRELGAPELACAAAALLSERDTSARGRQRDFADLLRDAGPGLLRAAQARESALDLLRRMGLPGNTVWKERDLALLGAMLARAFPDRLGKRDPIEAVFRFPSGREARAPEDFSRADWLCALEVDPGERLGRIALALALDEEAALGAIANKIHIETSAQWEGLAPRLVETKKAGRIILSSVGKPCRRAAIAPLLPAMLRERGIATLFKDAQAAERLLARARFYESRSTDVASFRRDTRWSDATLIEEAEFWLGPFVWGGAESGKGDIIDARGLRDAIAARIGYDEMRLLDSRVPDSFALPSGRSRFFDYSSGEPVARLRLQDAFDAAIPRTIMGAQVVFHLLSPADRPVQITRDLDGFWKGSYKEARKEMKARYPKHRWPERPGG